MSLIEFARAYRAKMEMAAQNGLTDQEASEVITVSEAFAKDEFGWWKDEVYKSLYDGNVYTPDEYSNNWEKIKKEV